ncbi:MAG TPA: hypothetical protein DHV15_10035 [Treponema sp.]|uniref:Uncharacterized protein n=1 Tax=Treponema denticola (strain ATCC 35405 / DSM 14222 / CIP 103919 / JCM 8153 / KCTC 15104) TaxID=243275 RepID=Q73L85_TREDE|nr:hypothetical protein TDE_1980 [Treponema denticola ATCC 35405]UTY26292.1 hypothetical protein E4N77_06145 [Treponema denticola]HCY95828.1 hypothetical protein [Treponema sp.]
MRSLRLNNALTKLPKLWYNRIKEAFYAYNDYDK